MAMPNLMVGEVEPGAGADTNSGWFCTLEADNSTVISGGTDYSQQASPQVTFNESTVTAVVSGTTVTITGYSVATTDKANTLRISGGSGLTTGLYQIITVNTGSNTWTVDRSAGTGTGMTGTMGGALATLAQAFSDLATIVSAFTNGNNSTIWYKSGTDTITSGLTMPDVLGCFVHGYQATRGDNTGTRPLLTTSTNSVNMITAAASGDTPSFTFNNVSFSNTASTRGVGFYAPGGGIGRNVTLVNCKLSGFSYGVFGNYNTNFLWGSFIMYGTEITSCVYDGFNNAGSNSIYGCYIHGNGGAGITTINPQSLCSTIVMNSIIATNTTHGIYFQGNGVPLFGVVQNCILYNNTDCGILIQSNGAPTGAYLFANNIFQSNGTYGIENQALSGSYPGLGPFNRFNNAFYLNGTAATYGLLTEPSDITLTASAFVADGTNFALNATSGGGPLCSALGYPGVFPASVATGYISIGAVEPNPAGGGGGGGSLMVNSNLEGGLQ